MVFIHLDGIIYGDYSVLVFGRGASVADSGVVDRHRKPTFTYAWTRMVARIFQTWVANGSPPAEALVVGVVASGMAV